MSTQNVSASSSIGWRTPAVVVVCGCIIALLGFGPRSAMGFFLTPMSQVNNWGREVFAFALAVQNLLWGAGQPFAGAIADRYGAPRVLVAGALLYAAGLFLMAFSTTPTTLTLSAGVLIGFGLSGCSFTIVVGAFGKLLPDEWRTLAFGLGTAAGSFGQFLFSPLAVALIGPDKQGWAMALIVFAALMLIILPLSLVLATTPKTTAAAATAPVQSYKQASPGRSSRPPLLHPARAWLLYLRLPARIHHRAPAGLSERPGHLVRGGRLYARGDRFV